ncbi:putative arsenical pump membrane protein [Gordonia polyisoprenivorans VH2]|uniref:Putative arsenical pump membrane protein n=2 Tax=Gordonia polyisoprenivorans TaxID=84595 RepID=H6MT32_GORPV|nr:SLC13 family permease [Gordonia polyisoprenivorans]AFA75153.1 putative arsenical pump membrane protein [Gordonia polyisoprenivorans VH2]
MLDVHSPLGTAVAVIALIAVIGIAVSAQRLSPAIVAVPAAVLVTLLGIVSWSQVCDELEFIGPTIGFLAAMLVVAEVCARTGVFAWVGQLLADWSRGSPTHLLGLVFVAAALTTAVLSIDTTIVLLTPVAVATARRIGARVTPVGTATAHLANSASTLLPVSNLTNLLAFSATGLGFLSFAGLMAAPWVVAIVVEYVIFRIFFAGELQTTAPQTTRTPAQPHSGTPERTTRRPAPVVTLILLGLLLCGFVVAEPLGIPLAAIAGVGAAVMLIVPMRKAPVVTAVRALRAVNIPFLAFVAALGIIILPIRLGPIGEAITHLIPGGNSLWALLAVAALAAVAANVLNNLPATLLLLPMVANDHGLALAMLLGVNIGPNLAYFGSLANLLWRDVMRRHTIAPPTRRYVLLGTLTVPPTLIAAVVALWVGLQVM